MAYSKIEALYTYQQKRVPFYNNSERRGVNEQTDVQFYNTFVEVDFVPATGQRTYWIKKRPGLGVIDTHTIGGYIHGSIYYKGVLYFVAAGYLWKWVNSVYTQIGAIGLADSLVGMVAWTDNQEREQIVFGDGTTLWTYLIATNVIKAVPAGYPTPFIPQIQSIDGYIAMVKQGTADIYTSQVQDMSTGVWDFISAELYPDNIAAFARYNNYLVALGTNSTEMFYDAAIAKGSPLARNDSTVITIGCASPLTAVQVEDRLYWVGNAGSGQLGVWELYNFKTQEISNTFIRKQISKDGPSGGNNPANYRASYVRVSGKRFYLLGISTSTPTSYDELWAYDLDEKVWAQWDFSGSNATMEFVFDQGDGIPYFITAGGVMYLYDSLYVDPNSTPINCYWITENQDFETYNRKVAHRLSLVGDIDGTPQNIQVSYSNDDYQTWSTPRNLDLSQERPALTNLGMFRRRAWKFQYSGNTRLRLQGMELYYNQMVN